MNRISQILMLVLLIGLSLYQLPAQAGRWSFLDDLVRSTAKVDKSVPLKNLDEVAGSLKQSGKARRPVDDMLRKHHPGATQKELQVLRKRSVLNQLKKGMSNDPTLLKKIDALGEGARETALVLLKGGKGVAETIPDLAIRGKLVRAGGADLIAATGLYGDEVAKTAFRFQSMLEGGRLVIPKSMRQVNLSDFVRALTLHGKNSLKFFDQHIQPYWKNWVSSGLLAWWIINPDHFQTTLGEWTQTGIAAVTELGGEIAASIVEGVVEGGGKAMNSLLQRVWQSMRSNGAGGALFVLFSLFGLALLSPRFRRWFKKLWN